MKPTQSSAATTAFCAEKIEGRGWHLWIDGNGKITAANGTLDAPRPNAFSLVQIEDCPGSTDACRKACYVHGLQKHAPDTHALYRHNSAEIRRILPASDLARECAERVGAWIDANCRGGFRWHVSGDVFSDRYAQWIAFVCSRSPQVGHWIYTRSLQSVKFLVDAKNLAINISGDRDNYAEARSIAERYHLRLCYFTADGTVPDDLRAGDVIFPDYALRGGNEAGQEWFAALSPDYKSYVCPVDYHGKSERRRCGPCARCLT